jgi:hypothetical protein
MSSAKKTTFLIGVVTLMATTVFGTFESRGAPKSANKNPLVKTVPAKQAAPTETTSTVIEYDDETPDDPDQASGRPIERLFKNPIFASGISSGADAINQSIETLMESIFYNLMDNKLKWPLTDTANMTLGFTRDVFSARSGAYVIVDRFGLGPEYNRELYRYNGIPINLGANQSTDVYDIYLRTDPMRVLDNKNLPWWRTAINNWFGALPLLEAILPPSFNANELYDPLKRLEAPFNFPLSIPAVESMDIGTIKSYAISGGINIGAEIADGIHGLKDQMMTGPTALDMKLPYTVFRTGEYRVNILKKDTATVWVGVSDTSRLGHRFESKLGKTYYLLSKTIPLWRGMPAHVFPIDFAYEEGVSDIFSRVYAFNLRNDEAKTAFIEAVHGNFAAAQISALRAKEDGFDTGVKFFHDKNEKRFDRGFGTGHSAFIINKKTKRMHSDAEIEITDNTGRFHILEAKEDHDVARWNMLTGRSEQNITLQAELKVRKVVEKETDNNELKSRFEFIAEDNTVDVGFSLAITDKFVETEELADYLSDLSRFTKLEMTGLPQFATREPDLLAERRRAAVFQTDMSRNHLLHVTPTHLGRFEGYASVRLTHAQMQTVASLPRQVLWLAFCSSFKITDEETCLSWEQSLWRRNLYRSSGLLLMPLRLLDLRWHTADAVNEIEDAVAALKDFEKSTTPEEKQIALRRFFATEYPLERVEALLAVSDLKQVPRQVELETQSKGNAPEAVRKKFAQMNGHRFRGERSFPPPARYDSTKDVESKFDPANLTFFGIKPRVKKISLYKEPVARSPKLREATSLTPVLVTKTSVSRLSSSQNIRVYVRLEQAGRVQLAKLKLIEDVVEIPVTNELNTPIADRNNFIVKLSGPQSVIANVISEEAIASGGEFKLTLAVSTNGLLWSDEKHLEFRIEDGKLLAR